MAFRLAYLHLTLAHFKDQRQDHAHFDWEYLKNGDRSGKRYYCHQICYSMLAFRFILCSWNGVLSNMLIFLS